MAAVGALVLAPIGSAQTPEPSKNVAPIRAPASGFDLTLPTASELKGIEIGPALRRLVRQLDAPSYEAREEAMGRFSSGACDRLQLYALLAEPGLSAEQRYRLIILLSEQLLESPRGAVGIRVNTGLLHSQGIIVQDLLPGLPAEEVLQVGDRLTRLDGDLLETWPEFVIAVQRRPPGERVELTIERLVRDENGDVIHDENGDPVREQMQVELVLGSADQLIDPLTGEPQTGGALMQVRQDEARQARRMYGPRPNRIEIRGAGPTLSRPGGPIQ